jgi:hypothetical protein
MFCDLPLRHRQALDPDNLDSIAACLHALQEAARDCRAARLPLETDPSVVLLARHLGAVANRKPPSSAALRATCAGQLSALDRQPLLALLARRGVAGDRKARRLFHSAARVALEALAQNLALEAESYAMRINKGSLAVSGDVTLHGHNLYVQVSIGRFPSHEILYRAVRGRDGYPAGKDHFARMDELLAPDRLAMRIAADLGLARPSPNSAAPRE